jgi:hypothetical protein
MLPKLSASNRSVQVDQQIDVGTIIMLVTEQQDVVLSHVDDDVFWKSIEMV